MSSTQAHYNDIPSSDENEPLPTFNPKKSTKHLIYGKPPTPHSPPLPLREPYNFSPQLIEHYLQTNTLQSQIIFTKLDERFNLLNVPQEPTLRGSLVAAALCKTKQNEPEPKLAQFLLCNAQSNQQEIIESIAQIIISHQHQ